MNIVSSATKNYQGNGATKMTKKRFVQKWEDNNYEDFMIIDNQQNKILYNDEILNTMNKLHEENQQLKKREHEIKKIINNLETKEK